ncbi:hypothetical protein M3J09_003169 [Ascochyta lentis]
MACQHRALVTPASSTSKSDKTLQAHHRQDEQPITISSLCAFASACRLTLCGRGCMGELLPRDQLSTLKASRQSPHLRARLVRSSSSARACRSGVRSTPGAFGPYSTIQ